MIHNKGLKKFYFIDDFNKDHIRSLNKNISIIYRNYTKKYNQEKIIEIKKFCKNIKKEFFLANDVNLTNKLNLDGAYIPAFNNSLSVYKLKNKNMTLLGSAHNLKEINQKKRQGIDIIFIAPTFKVNKSNNFLGVTKFNILANLLNGKTIALGGINKNNIKKIKMLNCYGYASISYIKKHNKI
jgi:thiamine-phosphate pyrophosphorylase